MKKELGTSLENNLKNLENGFVNLEEKFKGLKLENKRVRPMPKKDLDIGGKAKKYLLFWLFLLPIDLLTQKFVFTGLAVLFFLPYMFVSVIRDYQRNCVDEYIQLKYAAGEEPSFTEMCQIGNNFGVWKELKKMQITQKYPGQPVSFNKKDDYKFPDLHRD
ncbi:MAG: hypothetical protein ACK4K4_06240 [Caldimicrobium sp.]